MTAPPARQKIGPLFRSERWRFDANLTLIAVAAGLLQAAVYWTSAAFELTLPLGHGLNLQVRPALVVPLFVGLTQGPVAAAITGLLGQALGQLLAMRLSGVGALVIGVAQSGLLGLLAGLGRPHLRQFRAVRHLGTMLAWTVVASLGAQLLPVAAILLAAQFRPAAAVDLNVVGSGLLTCLVNSGLLLPSLLMVWDRRLPRPGLVSSSS